VIVSNRSLSTSALRERAIGATVLAGCLVLPGCASEPESTAGGAQESASAARPGSVSVTAPAAPLVIISVDTLRADHLPEYGYEGIATPAITRLAADGIIFENAFAHAPSTLASHASLFTGQLPGQHGVRDNIGYALSPGTSTLALMLAQAGYATGAAISAFPLRADSGLAAGFASYDAELAEGRPGEVGKGEREGAETLEVALEWVREHAHEPFFLFLHLYEPHAPYVPPARWAALAPTPYDGEILRADELVGQLLAELRRLEVYDEALVVFLSDHGESLGEHVEDEHGILLYTTTLRVPLIVKLPERRRAGERVVAAAQLVDVLPTVTGLLELETPAGLPGQSLLELADGAAPRQIYSETYAPRLHFGWSEMTSLIEYPLHFIRSPQAELFDLSSDPDEQSNLLTARPDDAARMDAALVALGVPLTEATGVDPEVRDRLAALGYVDLGVSGPTGEILPDPKSRMEVLRQLQAATAMFYEGRMEEAVREFERLLELSPMASGAWEYLGRAHMALGNTAQAAEAMQVLRQIGASNPDIDLVLADLYLVLERFDDARATTTALTLELPLRARVLRSRIERAAGNLGEAERAARAAIARSVEFAQAHAALAMVLMDSQTRLPEALREVDLAILHASDDPTIDEGWRALRGRLLLVAGDLAGAERAFVEEINRHPDSMAGYTYLAGLALLGGDDAAALRVLDDMVRRMPGPPAEHEAIRTLEQFGRSQLAQERLRAAAAHYPEAFRQR